METVQPIRDVYIIEQIRNILRKRENGARNELMFTIGINTGLRISDILKLKVGDVHNQTHILLRETKTAKAKRVKVNGTVRAAVNEYVNCNNCCNSDGKLFDISRVQAYRIISGAARIAGIKDLIGTHTLRKTFGYHHYQKNKDVALLQNIFNHSSPSVTLRYIGVSDDMMDESVDELGL
jgi:integrase